MASALLTGLLAGALLGVVLHRGRLCFHSLFAGALVGRDRLLRGWLLGVAVAAVGLSVVYLLPGSDDLNQGLAFRPVSAVVGGLVLGVGMVVAQSCVSGLFSKLGSGMLGALVGLAGWAAGELAVRPVDVPGPTVLGGGEDGTLAGLLGVPRPALAAVLLVAVVLVLRRGRDRDEAGPAWRWTSERLGVALGLAIVASWLLADLGGRSFGASSVGTAAGIADGDPSWWLVGLLVGITAGALLSARLAGDVRVRGETPVRYGQLLVGGALLGAGGWIAGGCNLGHGLSGTAQLNVSSWVVVASMAGGVWLARAVRGRVTAEPAGSRAG